MQESLRMINTVNKPTAMIDSNELLFNKL